MPRLGMSPDGQLILVEDELALAGSPPPSPNFGIDENDAVPQAQTVTPGSQVPLDAVSGADEEVPLLPEQSAPIGGVLPPGPELTNEAQVFDFDGQGETFSAGQPGLAPGQSMSGSISGQELVTKDPNLVSLGDTVGEAKTRLDRSGITGGTALQMDAVKRRGQAQAAQATAEAGVVRELAEDYDVAARNEAIANEKASEAQRNYLDTMGEASQRISMMQVDPNRIWNKSSTPNKILSLVAAGIGGFLTAGGVPNNIQQILDNAINRDIDAQKANITNAQRGFGRQRMMLADELGIAKSEAASRATHRALRQKSLITGLEAMKLQYKNPQIIAGIDETIGKLQVGFGKTMLDASKLVGDETARAVTLSLQAQTLADRRAQFAAKNRGGGLSGGAKAKKPPGTPPNAIVDTAVLDKDGHATVVGIYRPEDKSGMKVAKFQEQYTKSLDARRVAHKILTIMENGAMWTPGLPARFQPEKAQLVEQLATQLAIMKTYQISGAQAREAEFKRIKKAFITQVNSLTQRVNPVKFFRERLAEGDRAWANNTSSFLVDPKDPKGRPVKVADPSGKLLRGRSGQGGLQGAENDPKKPIPEKQQELNKLVDIGSRKHGIEDLGELRRAGVRGSKQGVAIAELARRARSGKGEDAKSAARALFQVKPSAVFRKHYNEKLKLVRKSWPDLEVELGLKKKKKQTLEEKLGVK